MKKVYSCVPVCDLMIVLGRDWREGGREGGRKGGREGGREGGSSREGGRPNNREIKTHVYGKLQTGVRFAFAFSQNTHARMVQNNSPVLANTKLFTFTEKR